MYFAIDSNRSTFQVKCNFILHFVLGLVFVGIMLSYTSSISTITIKLNLYSTVLVTTQSFDRREYISEHCSCLSDYIPYQSSPDKFNHSIKEQSPCDKKVVSRLHVKPCNNPLMLSWCSLVLEDVFLKSMYL